MKNKWIKLVFPPFRGKPLEDQILLWQGELAFITHVTSNCSAWHRAINPYEQLLSNSVSSAPRSWIPLTLLACSVRWARTFLDNYLQVKRKMSPRCCPVVPACPVPCRLTPGSSEKFCGGKRNQSLWRAECLHSPRISIIWIQEMLKAINLDN